MTTTSAAYQDMVKSLSRRTQMTAREPTVTQAVSYYEKNISKAKTIDAFIGDFRLFSFAMKAYGLSEMTYARGFMKKILTEGVTDPKATARKMTDPRYLAFAKAFDFKGTGPATTASSASAKSTINKFVQQSMEDQAGQDNPGVKLALYFRRQAPGVKSAFGILADPALLKVVQTAFSIPRETSAQSIDTQAATIRKVLAIADLSDPKKLERIIQRFTAMYDLSASQRDSASSQTSPITSSPIGAGFSNNLLMSIQSLSRNGR